MNILVTDGENRAALAVTRSLAKRGCRVIVTSKKARSLSSSSRYCDHGIAVPDPLLFGPSYIDAIRETVARENVDIVFPMTEQSICLLNQIRDTMPGGAVLACPPADRMEAVSNKFTLCKLAEKVAVPVPHTWYISDPGDFDAQLQEIDRYPVVVKPAMSKLPEGNGFISGGVMYASSSGELKHLYASQKVLRYPSLIQEKIVGPGVGLFTLYDVDRHLALFSHRRIREKPPSGGVSVVSESIPLDPALVEDAGRLLSAIGWTGVAMVEFKRDLRDGTAKLMEINGRFWGSLQLAISSGVDFPALFLDYLQGGGATPLAREYNVGHKLKWFFGTLDHLLIRLRYSDEALNLPPGAPSRFQAIRDFFNILETNTSCDVFDWRDGRPFIFEASSYFRQTLGLKR